MRSLLLEELDARADELDRVALAAPDIDRFCSSSSWVLPAAEALTPGGTPWLYSGPDGFLATVVRQREGVRAVEPLEASWGLACPLVGGPAARLAAAAADILRAREAEWDLLLLSGMPLGAPLLREVIAQLAPRYRLGRGPVTRRHVASLGGGVDGFLSRRSRALRKSLRQSQRRARAAGVVFAPAAAASAEQADALFDRILALERRSWKGAGGVGVDTPEMREFYRRMLGRLVVRSRMRCLFATADGEDVAYVLGAVFGDTYRGLQFSFDDRRRSLGLGNLAQLAQVTALDGERSITRYDLGTGGDYKSAWAEQVVDSIVLIGAR